MIILKDDRSITDKWRRTRQRMQEDPVFAAHHRARIAAATRTWRARKSSERGVTHVCH